MTTFTRIPEDQTPCISIDVSRRLAKINPNIYGGFTEHIGRCIYGGIYEPGSSLSDKKTGFRKDVLAALKELKVPVVRYPGGNFVASYHWMDGIGPKELRPTRPELAWRDTETNQFGTDEFLHWCEVLGTQPYLCFNMGTGTLDEALAWVEYCNGSGNTHYANLRRKNGREKPWNVKYWGMGNEVWGDWQIEQTTMEAYATKTVQWAKALKKLDGSLELILCGNTGHTKWDQHVLLECIPFISMHSLHTYTSANHRHLPNVTAPRCAERSVQIASGLIDLARIERGIPPWEPRQTICFDEWNVWDSGRANPELGAEEQYTLSDALAVGAWLNVFIRQAKDVGMACIAQSVNVISPLMTTKKGIWKQTTWWPLLLFCKYMRGETVGVHLWCGTYDGDTEPWWIRSISTETPWLDVSACVDDDGWVGMVVINIHPDNDFKTDIKGLKKVREVKVFTVTGSDVEIRNGDGVENVKVKESSWDAEGKFTFGKHSLTLLRWKVVDFGIGGDPEDQEWVRV
ncbi:glycoside hydrolase family 51 protein [Stipitochalara longipes BDJ]|nr:glycoside hydrolase family 51 protein [Stipitochalara longipes BDJ]